VRFTHPDGDPSDLLLPLELVLNGVEPLALGVERAPGVVVNQPQVPRAVGDLERAPVHLLQVLVGALDAGAHSREVAAIVASSEKSAASSLTTHSFCTRGMAAGPASHAVRA
jgi:hypothetical protein